MADMNDAIQQFLQQMQQQGSTGPANQGDLPVSPIAQGSTGPANTGVIGTSNTRWNVPFDQGYKNTNRGLSPPSGGSIPSLQQQPNAPDAQNQGASGAAGAQMPPGILQAMIQKLLGMQPQGQQVTTQGGLGQIAPDWRPAQ